MFGISSFHKWWSPSAFINKDHTNNLNLPNHIAIIMDGNGRWARRRALPRIEGHIAGTRNVARFLESLEKYQIPYVTLFAFSTENWNRPVEEVQSLMDLLQEALENQISNLVDKNVRLRYVGRMDRLSKKFGDAIYRALEVTKSNTGLNLTIALDYGGRDEIVQAVKRIVRESIASEDIDNRLFEQYLYTSDLPDPDLVIRTAGEQRLSNFLVWQSAYSEYYYSSVCWPDFDDKELLKALRIYTQRKRRFGALVPGE